MWQGTMDDAVDDQSLNGLEEALLAFYRKNNPPKAGDVPTLLQKYKAHSHSRTTRTRTHQTHMHSRAHAHTHTHMHAHVHTHRMHVAHVRVCAHRTTSWS